MSRDIVLSDKQTGYDVVAEYAREYWEENYYSTAIVQLATSYDGEDYHKYKEVIIPQDGDVEFLNDWWEGEKYIKIFGVKNVDDIEIGPTADVVEVVRCKDCKHRYEPTRCALWCGTVGDKEYFVARGENFYCSYGERREE